MIDFFLSGGVSMIFVLLFGGAAVGAAAMTITRPSARVQSALRSLSLATAFSSIAGVASCFAAVGYHVTGNPAWAQSPDLHLLLLTGVAESMSPAVLGFALLALAWVIAAGARSPAATAAA